MDNKETPKETLARELGEYVSFRRAAYFLTYIEYRLLEVAQNANLNIDHKDLVNKCFERLTNEDREMWESCPVKVDRPFCFREQLSIISTEGVEFVDSFNVYAKRPWVTPKAEGRPTQDDEHMLSWMHSCMEEARSIAEQDMYFMEAGIKAEGLVKSSSFINETMTRAIKSLVSKDKKQVLSIKALFNIEMEPWPIANGREKVTNA